MRRSSSSCASGRGRSSVVGARRPPRQLARLARRDHVARQRDAQARAEAARTAKAPRRDGALRRGGRGSRRGGERAPASSLVHLLVAGETVEEELLARVSTLPHPARAIGVYRRADLPTGARETCLALWRLSDPGNVGTLLRTADAFGACVALSEGCADPLAPKALRASAGAVFRMPIVQLGRIARGRCVALVAHGGAALSEADLTPPVTLLLGAERAGLPDERVTGCYAGDDRGGRGGGVAERRRRRRDRALRGRAGGSVGGDGSLADTLPTDARRPQPLALGGGAHGRAARRSGDRRLALGRVAGVRERRRRHRGRPLSRLPADEVRGRRVDPRPGRRLSRAGRGSARDGEARAPRGDRLRRA